MASFVSNICVCVLTCVHAAFFPRTHEPMYYCTYRTKITTIGRLSGPLKRTYATKHNLDYKRLLSDGPYKEMFRKDMIVWGETSRKKNFRVFADIVLSDSRNSDVLIVSDARRVTDMTCFRNQKTFQTISIRVQASVKERSKRGFVFKTGIDDAESECGLDNVHHDVMIYNQGPAAMSRNSKAVRKLKEFRTTPNYIGGVDDQLYTIALHVKKLL
jgi:phosphomevalonate kinase